MDFQGSRVVITGASGGVGSALVDVFADLGACVVACGRDLSLLEGIAAAEVYAFDQTDARARGEALAAILAPDRAPPAAVISNAGATAAETLEELDSAALERELALNLTSAMEFTRAFLPSLRKRGSGSFVFISSVNAYMHYGNPAYAAAKAGLLAWMRALATEEGGHGLRANALAPGSILTAAWAERLRRSPDLAARLYPLYPLGRLVTPKEVARAAAFLASSWASGITGATLTVDGGLSAGNLPFLREITAKAPS